MGASQGPQSDQGGTDGGQVRAEAGLKRQVPLQPGRRERAGHRHERAYERKESALNGIESVKTNAPGAALDDQTEE
jgi:hypothetical protein